jgi:hypothetical protein
MFHWTAPRVRGHVLLCMLAYHVEYQMRARLAPMLYDETDHEAAAGPAAPNASTATAKHRVRRRPHLQIVDKRGEPDHYGASS